MVEAKSADEQGDVQGGTKTECQLVPLGILHKIHLLICLQHLVIFHVKTETETLVRFCLFWKL